MALILGGLISGNSGVDHDTNITTEINENIHPLPPYNSDEMSSIEHSSTSTKVLLTPASIVGSRDMKSFVDDYYEMIHVLPSSVNVGSITGDISTNVEIWNAYREESKQLTAIVETGTTGVSFSLTAPKTFNPLESTIETLDIFISGPAELAAEYELIFTGISSSSITATGERVLALPYIFGAPATETLKFKTDILNKKDGTEQRIRLRSSARNHFDVSLTIPNDEMQRAFNLIYGWRVNSWALPIWTQARIGSTVNAADLVISVDTTNAQFKVGGFVCIWQNAKLFQVVTITAFDLTSITINTPASSQFITPYVMPAVTSIMIKDPTRSHDAYNGKIKAEFLLIGNDEITSAGTLYPYADGIEEFYYTPLMPGKKLTDTIKSKFDIIDYDTGNITTFSDWTHAKVARKIKVIFETPAEIYEFKEWAYRIAGRQVPFYMPFYENSFTVTQTVTVTNSMVVSAQGYSNYAAVRTMIAIYSAGAWTYTKINTVIDNGNGTETLSLDDTLNFEPEDIVMISYVGLFRLDNDDIKMKWHPSGVVEVNLPIIELEP